MKQRRVIQILFVACIACLCISEAGASAASALFNSFSEQRCAKRLKHYLSAAPADMEAVKDTFHIFAFRVEFKRDTFATTTGTGEFGSFDFSIPNEKQEQRYYTNGTYKYDKLPHDYEYFSNQLEFVRQYYDRISSGRLHLRYSIFPGDEPLYRVDSVMAHYSPPGKRKKESYNDYYSRKTQGLITFTRDALLEAASHSQNSWLDSLAVKNGEIVDMQGHPVLFMLIHAGASYLTDGGTQGAFGQDTPGDMIDAFINRDFFEAYKDTVGLDTAGVCVSSAGEQFCIDEVMMVSETSNQDSLNWGIHGIMVNQVARAIGIPDLYNTLSGFSATGAFGIMDFAGYSSGYGFIPPWPSAWTRHFMGWDRPVIAPPDSSSSHRIRAISASGQDDTTMALVPVNEYEYYLVENRQRNLDRGRTPFTIDTSTTSDSTYIAAYPYNVDLDAVVEQTVGASNVIMQVRNFDVSLPATGVLVWHIDERIIRDRIEYNTINADSLYRGVHLVEADGITDFGIQFQDVFYQALFDYGGADDVFPHRAFEKKKFGPRVDYFGPWTRPATKSNDGGYTGLELSLAPLSSDTGIGREISYAHGAYVINYADSLFRLSVTRVAERQPVNEDARDRLHAMSLRGWPRKFSADSVFYEPVLYNCTGDEAKELIIADKKGRVYVIDTAGRGYGSVQDTLDYMQVLHKWGSMRLDSGLVTYERAFDMPAPAIAFPSVIASSLYIPTASAIYRVDTIRTAVGGADSLVTEKFDLSATATTYVCEIGTGEWAVGTDEGRVYTATAAGIDDSVSLRSTASVNALCAVSTRPGAFACVQKQGLVHAVSPAGVMDTVTLHGGIAPYSLVSAQLDSDDPVEIVVSDSRQGLWCLEYDAGTQSLTIAPMWSRMPQDWANYYTTEYDPPYTRSDATRARYPQNGSSASIADIDGDGLPDIVIGGTNGIYACNYKGVMLQQWPSYLDTRYAYYRRSLVRAPAIVKDTEDEPFVLFAPPTGENATFAYFDIDSSAVKKTDPESTMVYYRTRENRPDSFRLTTSLVDTLYTFFDSMITDIVMPGGYVDVMNSKGLRPVFVSQLSNTGPTRQSYWPLSVGASPASAPMIDDMDNDGRQELVMLTDNGFVYRWDLANLSNTRPVVWNQVGRTHARSFAWREPAGTTEKTSAREMEFYSYPNPAKGVEYAMFRFRLPGKPHEIKLDIYSYAGWHVYSWRPEADVLSEYANNWQGASEKRVSLRHFGSGVYRCRFEVDVAGGERVVKYWKMAVIK